MDDKVFEDELKAKEFIASTISRKLADDEQSTQLAEQLANYWEGEYVVGGPPGSLSLLIRRKRWVIRKDDLQLFDTLLDGMCAFAGVGFFAVAGATQLAQLAAIAAFVKGVLKVGKQAWTKGVPLSAQHFSVLYVLFSSSDGLTKSELLSKLNASNSSTKQAGKKSWTSKEVESCLEQLKSVPSHDGTPRQLVAKTAAGRWKTSGI